jgi:hypothetical protein
MLFEGEWITGADDTLVEGAATNGETGTLTEGDWQASGGTMVEGNWTYGGDDDLYEGAATSSGA